MKKVFKGIAITTLAVMLMLSGVFIGNYLSNQNIMAQEGTLYSPETIAVVNLDEGVDYNGTHRNFGVDLISTQEFDVSITGSDDAKEGVESGKYAAYMVIPADFSKNVISINTVPKTNVVLYEIGNNLTNETNISTIEKVDKLNNGLENSLNYLYLYSLFEEVHKGQDGAKQVLANDAKGKESILAISNLNLLQALEINEVERLENNLKQIDVDSEFASNKEVIESIDVAYKNYLTDVETESMTIKDEFTSFTGELTNSQKNILASPRLSKDGINNYTLDNTTQYLGNYNKSLVEFQDKLKVSNTTLETSLNDLQIKVNEVSGVNKTATDNISDIKDDYEVILKGIEDILSNQNQQAGLTDFDKLIDEKNDTITGVANKVNDLQHQNLIDQYIMDNLMADSTIVVGSTFTQAFIDTANSNANIAASLAAYASANEITGAFNISDYYTYSKNSGQEPLYTEAEIDEMSIDKNIAREAVSKDFNDLLIQFKENNIDLEGVELPTDYDEISTKIQEMVDENQNNKGDIDELSSIDVGELVLQVDEALKPYIKLEQENIDKLSLLLEGNKNQFLIYMENLNSFDPVSYIDADEVDGLVQTYNTNNVEINQKITSSSSEFLEFENKTYQYANTSVTSLKTDVKKYQTLSDEKVSTGLEDAKSITTNTSLDNQKLMNDFIAAVPYSRLGQSENTDAFWYMINPISYEETQELSVNKNIVSNNNDLLIVLMGITGIIFVGSLAIIITKKNKEIIE